MERGAAGTYYTAPAQILLSKGAGFPFPVLSPPVMGLRHPTPTFIFDKETMATTTPSCTYHCRSCESHFTSLEAFDAHRENYECVWPDDAPLVEIEGGVCKIGNPTHPKVGVTLYRHESAIRVHDHHRALEAVQTAQTGRKRGAVA